jgi:transposase
MERRHMNEVREIIHRFRCGEGMREIARSMDLSRNTVRKYRDVAEKHGLLESGKPLPENRELGVLLGPPPLPRHMRSTVEPYEEAVRDLLEKKVEMTAIWQRLRENYGYTGSYSSVRRFVQRLEPGRPEAVCRIETAAGEEAQVDFGSAGLQWDSRTGRRRKAWAFVMTLSNSRHQYVEFVFDQKIERWLQCHEHAFAWFGGVPRRVVVDNLKAGVIQPDLHDPVLGEPYRRLAQHYGFVISPNRPGTPRHKGKVESGVHYVKRNFLAGQTFADLEAMNQRVKVWIMETAGPRIHGTTKEPPLARFSRIERDALQPLPEEPFDLIATYRAKVHRDCHVVVNGRYYSVPYRYIGERVEVYVGRKIVEIYHGTDLVTTHPVAAKRGSRSTRSEHYPEGKRAYLENPPDRCRERAERIGPSCSSVVDTLLSDRIHDRLRSVQSLLRLCGKVGKERLEAACRRALHYGDPSYRRIKGILEARLDEEPLDTEEGKVLALPDYRYARPAASFFEREVPSSC